MRTSIREILAITETKDLLDELGKFEAGVDKAFAELEDLLARDIRTTEVATIQDHLTKVESYRNRVCKTLALVVCYVNHARSNKFMMERSKSTTAPEREGFQRGLAAGFLSLEARLKGLIDSIDSRVNECKLLLRYDEPANFGGRRA